MVPGTEAALSRWFATLIHWIRKLFDLASPVVYFSIFAINQFPTVVTPRAHRLYRDWIENEIVFQTLVSMSLSIFSYICCSSRLTTSHFHVWVTGRVIAGKIVDEWPTSFPWYQCESFWTPSERLHPVGSLKAGTSQVSNALWIRSLIVSCLAFLPELFLQANPCRPNLSTSTPQT